MRARSGRGIRPVGAVFLLGIAVCLTGGLTGWSAPARDWASVVEAAKREGQLVLYDGHGGAIPTIQFAAERFQRRYGIRVEVSVMRASEAVERVRIEQRAGRPVADLVTVGSTTAWQMKNLDRTLQPIGSLPSERKVSAQIRLQMEAWGIADVMLTEAVQLYGILINTQLVPPQEEPRSWMDLLDPRWRGKLITDDPRAPGGGFVFFAATYRQLGRRYHEVLATQRPFLTRAIAEAANRVARGEFAMMYPFALGLYPRIRELPNVKVSIPREGAPYVFQGVSMPQTVRHPHAARLFAEFLLSEEVQRQLARDYLLPAVAGTILQAPPEVRGLMRTRLWDTTDPPRADELLKVAAEIYR
ncbi:MAG: extracellular solute-binding protein [Armatimonadetes bacterium]|nr:extracellular solute-binding protein [Armatimonadota bacterium]MDW8153189.1 extracellular solute-binding protein [Armatimonadota bacterium]